MKGSFFMKKDISLLSDDEITDVFKEAVYNAVKRAKDNGQPICCYDKEQKKSYILYPNGEREYA